MARRKNRLSPASVDNPGGSAADILSEGAAGAPSTPQLQAEEADERDVIQQLREDAGNGAYVRIYRRSLGETEFAVLGKMDLSEYSLERVQEIYGGGEYKVNCFAVREGRHAMIRVLRFTISHSIPAKHPLAVAAPGAPGGSDAASIIRELQTRAAPQGPSENTLVSLFTLMMNQQAAQQASADARFEKLLAKISENAKPAGTDPLTLKLLDMTLAQQKTPMAELLETFHVFKKISGGGKDEDEDELTIWDKLGKVGAPILDALAAKYLSGGEPPPGMDPRLLPPAAEPGATDGAAPAGDPGEVVQLPPQGSNGAAPATTVQPNPPGTPGRPPAMNPLQRMMINKLRQAALVAAQQKADPAEHAQQLLDNVPPLYYENIEALAKAEDWIQQLYGDHPQMLAVAIQQKEWLGQLRDALLAELKESAAE